MTAEQRIVACGLIAGGVALAIGMWVLLRYLPAADIGTDQYGRIAYALRANVIALAPLFIMLITIANARFLGTAIDPTRGAADQALDINRRVARNTLEQTFLFVVIALALSTVISAAHLHFILASAVAFAAARCVFWSGYRVSPLYRAPGMAATGFVNLGMLFYFFYLMYPHR